MLINLIFQIFWRYFIYISVAATYMDHGFHIRLMKTLYHQYFKIKNGVMIRVNCVRFNMATAHAESRELGIGGLCA